MLGPTLFVLSDGRQIAPFHIAPWFERDLRADQPGILQRLRGEWPCVPFGIAADRAAHDEWPASSTAEEPDPHPHGFGANHAWSWIETSEPELRLGIDYPASHPISRLTRCIRPVPGRPAVDFELVIHTRHDCTLPIGLHPVFRLPDAPGRVRLEVQADRLATVPFCPDASSVLSPGQFLKAGQRVRLNQGGTLDPFLLPLDHSTEELLQLTDAGGCASLHHQDEGYRVTLDWNPTDFPDLLLWLSNRGRREPPWEGRHLAIGLEPVCSAFDLGSGISAHPNPLNTNGRRTARRFHAGERFATQYRVTVADADAAI
jgi:hypothetical protein